MVDSDSLLRFCAQRRRLNHEFTPTLMERPLMQISQAQIENYKGFRLSPKMNFSQGFNVIVGQNDAGKTALLESLSLRFSEHPHRSISVRSSGRSLVRITVMFTPQELKDLLRTSGTIMVDVVRGQETQAEQSFRALLESNVTLDCVVSSKGIISATLQEYAPKGELQGVLQFQWEDESNSFKRFSGPAGGRRVADVLSGVVQSRLYAFRAERLNIGKTRFGSATALLPNAQNLAEVLNNLQSSPIRYKRFNSYVSTIFPAVRWISVRAADKDHVKIFVWSVDPSTEQEDLAIPLDESGTGIGQVLAILYVALSTKYPQSILIDEPQSFLHPGAVRKLIEILKSHSEHQFIITTHAPYAITEAEPGAVFLVRKVDMESTVDALDARAADDLKLVLSTVGVRISDVFGVDKILWVEGSTEELCFPKIISRVSQVPLLGTVIIGVENTGDFETPRKLNAFSIYRRLSSSGDLLPKAVGFIFDREGRSEAARQNLIRESSEAITFLTRRMYENYLLHPHAIAELMSGIQNFPGSHSAEDVAQWIELHKWERRYFQAASNLENRSESLWLEGGHGAKLLQGLFSAFSENTVEYRKKEYGLLLTDWIITHDPEHLRELGDLLAGILAEKR